MILEALALRTPVIVTRCPGGAVELAGGYGVAVAPGDETGLRNAISSCLDSKARLPPDAAAYALGHTAERALKRWKTVLAQAGVVPGGNSDQGKSL